MRAIRRVLAFAPLAAAALLLRPERASGFAEEFTGHDEVRRSVAHADLTRALARCAGFSVAESGIVADADQAADLGRYRRVVLGFTDRGEDNDAFFHWPQRAGSLTALSLWASGAGALLDGEGEPIPGCDAAGTCCDPDTGEGCVDAGSLPALGIYLHALVDSYSHKACVDAGGRSHADFDPADADQSRFCPTTAHEREWGGGDRVLHENAIAGLKATRDALVDWRREQGLAVCDRAVTDAEITLYVSIPRAARRAGMVERLFRACDAACPSP